MIQLGSNKFTPASRRETKAWVAGKSSTRRGNLPSVWQAKHR